MCPSVGIDGGTAFDPAHGADQQIQTKHDAQCEEHQEQEITMRGPPERKLGEVDTEIVLGEWIRHTVGHALPGQRDLAPPFGRFGADQKAQGGSDGDGNGEEDTRCERLSKLQIGHVAANLDRAHRPINQKEMAHEPRARDQEAGDREGEPQDMPVGNESRGCGRELGRPPTVREEAGKPSPREEQRDQCHERGGEPPTAPGHWGYARTPCPASQATSSPR